MTTVVPFRSMTKTRDPQADLLRRNLQNFRQESGLSQAEVADLSGIGIDSVRKYESGANGIPATAIAALARVFGRNPGDFYSDTPPKGEPSQAPMFFLRTLPGTDIDEEAHRELQKAVDAVNERMKKKRRRAS